MARRRRNRFDVYETRCNPEQVERAGIVNSRRDFELGTASLERRENVSLLAANSRGESILASFKWRPSAKDKRVVTISTRFELESEGCRYEHRQVVSYAPQSSPIKAGFITQYGGQQSSLKFFISEPYRRMRLTFQGCARDERSGNTKFIKAGFVVCPTSGNFDFLEQYDAKFIKRQLAASGTLVAKGTAIDELVAHDRHEQLVQIQGEFTLIEAADSGQAPSRQKKRLYAWGFHIRQFSSSQQAAAMRQTKRILAHFTNGRAFHIGHQISSVPVQFGYSVSVGPVPEPLESCRVHWNEIADRTEGFEFEFTSQGKMAQGKASQRSGPLSRLLNAALNGVPGWAWVFEDNEDDSDERRVIERSAREFLEARESGRLAKTLTFGGNFGAKRPQIVRIDEQMCECSDLVGAKAASLAKLRSFSSSNLDANYVVPAGFVLTRFAHDAVLETNLPTKNEISKLEWLMGEGDLSTLKEECARLQQLVSEAKLPEGLRNELTAYIENNYSQEELASRCFAVRSSSWGEDEDDMSAAGQLSTILGVCGLEAILAAVMQCFASKFTVANIEYKRQHGLPASLPMAVVVQEMVDCEKAGVLFTCDPTTGDHSRLTITANYGLGESVVSGLSEPDTVTVLRSGGGELQIEESVVGAKSLVIDSETLRWPTGSQHQRDYDRSRCCLNEDEILRLAKCGLALAYYFQSPQDIEWAFKDNQLHLLQSRPVTGLDSYSEFELIHEADQPSAAENEFTTRANVGEVLPFAMKPMTMTCMFRLWTSFSARLKTRFTKNGTFECTRDLLCVAYHAFFNLRGPLMNVRTKTGEKHKSSKHFEISILGRELKDEPELRAALEEFATAPPSILARQEFRVNTLDLRLAPISTVRNIKRSLVEARQNLRALKFATGYHENKMLGLYSQMKHMFEFGFAGWRAHSHSFMICKEYNSKLADALAKHMGHDRTKVSGAMAKFLATSPDVLSAEIPQRVAKMAKMIKRIGRSEVDRFLGMTADEAVSYVLRGDDDKLTAEFKSFLDKFGHRCYQEFDLGSRQWSAEPGAVIEMIKQNCLAESDIVQKKPVTTDEIIDSLGLDLSRKDRFILKHLLVPKCQQFVSIRERTKDLMIEHSDLLRLATRMLAKEMRRNLRIPDEDLFYYLIFSEVEPLIREPQPSIVVQAVRRRHMFETVFKEPWRFDEIIRGYEFTPNHLKPSKELDEKLANAPILTGTPASSGRIQAKVCLVDGYKELGKVRPGDILLTHSTDIAFSPVFPIVSGIITEVGGLVSHGAVVAREYGLPSVLGIPNVTRILQDEEEIILDADTGTIIRINFMKSD